MKVCYWGTFERQYPRNSVLISGLRQNGIEVVECHFALWEEGLRYNKLTLLSGLRKKLRVLGRALAAYPYLILRYLLLEEHDAVVVGYLGHMDVLFLFPFARLRGKLIIFDAFFSLYDTAISDWGISANHSLLARILRLLDRLACHVATLVIVDTEAHRKFFCEEFGLPETKVHSLYVGADDSVFTPNQRSAGSDSFRVLYIGNHVPLHGISVILEAARILACEKIEFWLIGDYNGNDPALGAEITNPGPGRVRFCPWMPPRELRTEIAEADICLGIFGTSGKAKRVIPGKAFLALAMGRPLITEDSPAARELLEDGKTAILCESGNPHALADAILRLKNDSLLRKRIGEEGGKLFQTRCTPRVLGSLFASLIQETLSKRAKPTPL